MAPTTRTTNHGQGQVKDPARDGRLKQNREAGISKGTTARSAQRSSSHQTHQGQSSKSR